MSNTTTTSGTKPCYSCGCELVPVFTPTVYKEIPNAVFDPFSGRPLHPGQYDDALTVVFVGGYGEYFDDSDFSAIICRDCAEALRKAVPWIHHILGFVRGEIDNPSYLPCTGCTHSDCYYCTESDARKAAIEKSKADHPTAFRTVTDAVNKFRLHLIRGEKS